MQGQQRAAEAHVLLRRVRQRRLLPGHSDMHCLQKQPRSVLCVIVYAPRPPECVLTIQPGRTGRQQTTLCHARNGMRPARLRAGSPTWAEAAAGDSRLCLLITRLGDRWRAILQSARSSQGGGRLRSGRANFCPESTAPSGTGSLKRPWNIRITAKTARRIKSAVSVFVVTGTTSQG